jgi:hypothetical protein
MTALNFALQPDAVYIVADTLVTGPEFRPAFFTTKVFPVPHWNGIICGTGSLGLIQDWVRDALGGTLAIDLTYVDEFATASLQRLFAQRPQDEQDSCTTTIYHFGLDQQEGVFKGFAYRSTNAFESEPLRYGFHLKPYVDLKDRDVRQFPDDFATVMREQRIEQDLIPEEDRVFIGGHVLSWMMELVEREGELPIVRTTILPAYEWDDFEVAYATALEALHKSR